jgi:putative transposase
MGRLAHTVFEGVTQRGAGRARTFFGDADYQLYRTLLAENAAKAGVELWGWALCSPCPSDPGPFYPDGLSCCLALTHRRHAGVIHGRERGAPAISEGRFGCVAMDEAHLGFASRYVGLYLVRGTALPAPSRCCLAIPTSPR